MKTRNQGLLVLCIASAFSPEADASGLFIPWRANDPFVFCTQGPPADHQWRPVDPASGTWVATGKYPNMISLGYYLRICPQGRGRAADWRGKGRPELAPFKH